MGGCPSLQRISASTARKRYCHSTSGTARRGCCSNGTGRRALGARVSTSPAKGVLSTSTAIPKDVRSGGLVSRRRSIGGFPRGAIRQFSSNCRNVGSGGPSRCVILAVGGRHNRRESPLRGRLGHTGDGQHVIIRRTLSQVGGFEILSKLCEKTVTRCGAVFEDIITLLGFGLI